MMTTSGRLPERSDAARTLRWLVGGAVTMVRYAFARVPLYRRNRGPDDSGPLPDLDRDLPGDPAGLQRARDGVGALYHRRYWVEVTDEDLDEEALIDRIVRDLNHVTPQSMARFEGRSGGEVDGLDVGDELVVRLPGPWDGPVRVIDRTPTSFRFVTLAGHLEAGEIEFRAGRTHRGFLRFEIESWARSGDRTVEFLYDRLPLAREIQLLMWTQFCQQAAKTAGGVVMSNVSSFTERIDDV